MIVTGIDLSLTATGLARFSLGDLGRVRSIATATVRSSPAGGSVEARLDRLDGIVYDVAEFVLPGSLVVIEAPAFTRSDGARHERSGLWWMVAREAKRKGCRVLECSPTARQKYAVGKAGSSTTKKMVLDSMRAQFPAAQLANDNEADALVLAAIGCRLAGVPVDADTDYRVASAESVKGGL